MTAELASTTPLLRLNDVEIVDTFAEAFPIKAARLVITAATERWALTAANELCGNAHVMSKPPSNERFLPHRHRMDVQVSVFWFLAFRSKGLPNPSKVESVKTS